MSASELRNQILINAKFLFGPDRQFEVITTAVLVSEWHGSSQAILVEINQEDGTYKTHLIARNRSTLEETLQDIHLMTNKRIYQKLDAAVGLNDEPLQGGEVEIEGQLEWN